MEIVKCKSSLWGLHPRLIFRARGVQSRNDWVIHRDNNTTNTPGIALPPCSLQWILFVIYIHARVKYLARVWLYETFANSLTPWRHGQKAFRLKNARWLLRFVLPLIRRVWSGHTASTYIYLYTAFICGRERKKSNSASVRRIYIDTNIFFHKVYIHK